MQSRDIDELLDKYLKGETTILENDQVERWLAANELENTQFESLDAKGREKWVSKLWNDIDLTISQSDKLIVTYDHKSAKVKILPLWKKLTAVAAIFFVVMALWVFWPAGQKEVDTSSFVTLNVPAKLKKKITLDDGSVVWVNSLGQLRYPAKFRGNSREVFLSGEAYFDIHHDLGKPFIVHTGKVKTTVLGTAFNINSNNSRTVVVTVTRGKVRVTDQNHLIAYITPNQQLIYNMKDNSEQKLVVNAKTVVAWQDDLHFNDITFGEAATILQSRFKVKISFTNDMIRGCRFSGTALEGNDVNQILKVICAFNQATYKYNPDGSIIIDGVGCVNQTE